MGGGGGVQERKINVSCRFHPSPARHFNYFDDPCGGKFKRINKGKEVTLFLKSDDADTRINTI